jgi:hypothetical protein
MLPSVDKGMHNSLWQMCIENFAISERDAKHSMANETHHASYLAYCLPTLIQLEGCKITWIVFTLWHGCVGKYGYLCNASLHDQEMWVVDVELHRVEEVLYTAGNTKGQ